jgi:hypothetical protein
MHRYTARALACLAISLAFAVLQIVVPHGGKKEVTVRTNGQTADIVAAVEALKRSDVSVKVADDPWVANPVGGIVMGTLGMAVVLWLGCGVVKRGEEWIAGFAEKKSPNQSAADQRP